MSTAADVVSVLVAPGRKMRGVANLMTLDPDDGEPWGLNRKGKPAEASLHRASLRTVLDREFKSHIHLVCYYVEDADSVFDKAPRLTKDVLGQVREAGADVLMWGVCIDWDLKDHPPLRSDEKVSWDSLDPEQMAEAISALEDGGLAVGKAACPWNVFYTTKNGARFVHIFPEPVPAGPGFENIARKVHGLYRDAGLVVDAACKDWTRFFAVPRCTHDDGLQTWTED